MCDTMGAAEKLEGLCFISRTHRSLIDRRASARQRAFYTVVTFYAAIMAARLMGKLTLPIHSHLIFSLGVWGLVLTVACLFALYASGLHASNRVSRGLAHSAEGTIVSMLGLPPAEGAGKLVAKTRYWQMSMVFLLAASSGVVLTVL